MLKKSEQPIYDNFKTMNVAFDDKIWSRSGLALLALVLFPVIILAHLL